MIRLFACLCLLAVTGLTSANPRVRVCNTHQAVVVAAPVVHTPYVAPYVATQVIPVQHSPDYYYSAAGYSRDRLLVDALAGRLLDLHRQGLFIAPAAPLVDPLPPKQFAPKQPQKQIMPPAEAGIIDDGSVNAKLVAVVQKSCLKCHQGAGAKGGLDLSNLSTIPTGKRWACFALTNGEPGKEPTMPQGGQPLADADVALFYQWASGK